MCERAKGQACLCVGRNGEVCSGWGGEWWVPSYLYPRLSTKQTLCIHSRRRTYIIDAQLILAAVVLAPCTLGQRRVHTGLRNHYFQGSQGTPSQHPNAQPCHGPSLCHGQSRHDRSLGHVIPEQRRPAFTKFPISRPRPASTHATAESSRHIGAPQSSSPPAKRKRQKKTFCPTRAQAHSSIASTSPDADWNSSSTSISPPFQSPELPKARHPVW